MAGGVCGWGRWSEDVGVAPLQYQWAVGCRLFCLCIILSLFSFSLLTPLISLTVASSQGVAQDFMLSCRHCLILSSVPFCLAEVSCSLHSSAASTTSSCLSLSWFCIAVVFHFFGVILWVHLLFVDLLYFLIVRHPLPSARRAFSHGSVLRLFTLLWLVSGSQSCSCEAVSVSSMLWLVFRVDYVHKAPQLPSLTPTHPHIQNVKCLVEVVLLWNYFPSGNNLCRGFLINNLMKLRARWWYWGVDKSGQTKNMLGRHSWLCWACKFFHFTQVRRQYSR